MTKAEIIEQIYEKVGFSTIDTYPSDGTTWHIVLLDVNR